MNELMIGMFWGGLLMALPPIAVGVAITVFLLRQQRADGAERRHGKRD